MATAIIKFTALTGGCYIGLRVYMSGAFAMGECMRDDAERKRVHDSAVLETEARIVRELPERIAALGEED